MKKKNRSWIFASLMLVGILFTFVFVILETNIIFKNDNFSKSILFDSKIEGDSGYLTLERNDKSLSTVDWVTFKNNQTFLFFSDPFVKERVYINLPSQIESGKYYFNVKVIYLSGVQKTKEIMFRVI